MLQKMCFTFKETICLLLLFLAFSFSYSYSQGALCLYVNGVGEVVCSSYSNSGGPSEGNCAAEARASNPVCGMNLAGIDVSCASNIFGGGNVCLDDVPPHNITGQTQAACIAASNLWCPTFYYFFFVGNSSCRSVICGQAQGVLPIELIKFII